MPRPPPTAAAISKYVHAHRVLSYRWGQSASRLRVPPYAVQHGTVCGPRFWTDGRSGLHLAHGRSPWRLAR
ncbi:hypothetical protein PAI11_23380 [Patulibacter medicamentivorans]|uniref:Uncharacterized protein n=1 Tax=Patulibacter medicamentivorans TaxID=1097667 RepID=H0E688_9ACTN|nr:hypothetical protein PAI11_23380 [Patulibacter medicamentivorans]